MTEVKSLGFPGTRLVNMNSNLERYELSNPRFNAVHIFNIVFLPCVVTFGEQVEGFGESTQFGVHCFCRDVQDTAISNSWRIRTM